MGRLIVFLCLVAASLAAETSNDQMKDGQGKALDITSGLYTTMRNVAFPGHKLTDETKPIDSRFLMLMPGKVLNYFDYYPGTEYTNFIQNPDANSPEMVVPPHVMEKWFDLADNIPNYNPMNAQDTGKSFANVYTSILHEIKLLGLESKTKSEKAMMKQATDFLNEMVVDPENTNATVPRLTLYERYRDLYNDRKLEMEDLIDQKRRSVGFVDYELWFQRHYPSLQAKVESAYTRWLIFGDKENVELFITYMDTGSAGKQLEEARMVLRAAGVTSLDRTRTVYPVSFEPSDWYKYLLPEEQTPSRDQLQLMFGKLQSKINAINTMITAIQKNQHIASIVSTLKGHFNESQSSANSNTTDFMNAQIQCLTNLNTENTKNNSCEDYDSKRQSTILALMKEAEYFSTYQYAYSYQNTQQLQKEKSKLEAQLNRVEALLGVANPYLGGFLGDSQLAVANLTLASRDQQWLQFEYDHHAYMNSVNKESTSTSITARTSVHVFFFSAGGSYSYNKNTEDYNNKLSQSNLRVKGELLRVNIKRPWFKPELFEIPDITFSESQDGINAYVAPGRDYSESGFYDQVSKNNPKYKLPEYTTGFLLARKVELEFSGLDSETVTSTMNEMSHTSGGGGFLFFRASASVTKTKQMSHVQVKRTGNGMSVKIPGAQVIGYYTQVMPPFPVHQE